MILFVSINTLLKKILLEEKNKHLIYVAITYKKQNPKYEIIFSNIQVLTQN